MLATRVKTPFTRPGWVFEPKYDGWRIVAVRRSGRVTLPTRRGFDLAEEQPEIVEAIAALPGGDLVVDGEMVVLDARGVASFRLLQERNEPGAKRPSSSSSTASRRRRLRLSPPARRAARGARGARRNGRRGRRSRSPSASGRTAPSRSRKP